MDSNELRILLEQIRAGTLGVHEAVQRLSDPVRIMEFLENDQRFLMVA